MEGPIQRFQQYKESHPDWRGTFNVERWGDRKNPRFERIRVQFNRTVNDNPIEHTYCPVIDTETGEIYMDCSPTKIAAKHLTFSVLHPIYSILKTIYHLTIVLPLIVNGWTAYKKNEAGEETHFWRDTGHSIADIFRTPLYGLAITTAHLIGVGAAIFEPDSLYETQAMAGHLAGKLVRRRIVYGAPIFEGCMAPVKDLMEIGYDSRTWNQEIMRVLNGKADLAHLRVSAIQYSRENSGWQTRKTQTKAFLDAIDALETDEAKGEAEPVRTILIRNGLKEFAWGNVYFQQHNRVLFNQCGLLLDEDQPFRTAGTPRTIQRSPQEFSAWKRAHPNWNANVRLRDSDRFQRLRGEHEEHTMDWTLDTETGDIYMDCRRRKIFAKHLALTVLRPIHTVVKTIYHATIVLPLIANTVSATRHRSGSQFLQDNWNSLVDIFRTPAYGLLITGTHLIGVITAVYPNSLYYTRRLAGKLERDMLRTDRQWQSNWVLANCFSPFGNLVTHDITAKTESRIQAMRDFPEPCNGCRRLGADEVYISPSTPA